jgi:hypothetical protein
MTAVEISDPHVACSVVGFALQLGDETWTSAHLAVESNVYFELLT